MRIFQLLEFNQFNTGSVHQMFQAAEGLRERNHDVTIVSRPDAVLQAKAKEKGISFHGFRFRHEFDLRTARALRLLVLEKQPDVIHVHKGIAHSLALYATRGHPVGAFVVNRGVSFPLDIWNGAKYRSRRVDRVVTVCEQIRQIVIASGKLPPEKVEVVYAGTDVGRFDPAKWDPTTFRREKGIASDRFLLAQVGVRDWKGWRELIDAVSRLALEFPQIQLALIGCRSADEEAMVRRYAEEKRIAAAVVPVEYRTDMPSVFASCDAVVDASWDGTGITGTVREAMSMGKPVIATDCGGNAELVSRSDVGWLIPAKDVDALAAAIRQVITEPARAKEVAANARQHVIAGFSRELRISRLEDLYERIIQAKRGS